ncbi:MAG: hypothetical protein MRY74_14230 [Neomegalonema sp.]|nr:hypothetical protein [Neomegalonema sp.]
MQLTDIDADAQQHRGFAVAFNNRAWAMADAFGAGDDPTALLNAAHAAAAHWNEIGGPVEKNRAVMLLAYSYVLADVGSLAYPYAEASRRFCLEQKTEDWELALVEAIFALAARKVGDEAAARAACSAAKIAFDRIASQGERSIIEPVIRNALRE